MSPSETNANDEEARRRRIGQYVIAAAVVMIAAAGLVIWMVGNVSAQVDQVRETQNEIQKTQRDGIVRGLKLRAVGCRNIEISGGTFGPGDPCLERALRPYFQPRGQGGG